MELHFESHPLFSNGFPCLFKWLPDWLRLASNELLVIHLERPPAFIFCQLFVIAEIVNGVDGRIRYMEYGGDSETYRSSEFFICSFAGGLLMASIAVP